jgi:hypothetical protein
MQEKGRAVSDSGIIIGPFTKDGAPLTCPDCGGLSEQSLGVQSIVSQTRAYCTAHDPASRGRRSAEWKRAAATKYDSLEWRVVELESEYSGDQFHAIVAPGVELYVPSYGEPQCKCDDAYCEHIVAHDYPFYPKGPTLAQSRFIAQAVNHYLWAAGSEDGGA